jgi:uncharacterized protein (TIGR02588 family)
MNVPSPHFEPADEVPAPETARAGELGAVAEPRAVETSPMTVKVIAALGLLFTLAAIGHLMYQAATKSPTPPTVEFTVDGVASSGAGYVVTFRVFNHGSITAELLSVRGLLLDADQQPVETSEMTFDYLPPGGTRHGGLFFASNPADYDLDLRALGYQQP